MRTQSWIPLLAALAGRTIAQTPSLTDLLTNTPNLSSLLDIVSGYPDLVETLGGASDITIFAPDNDAFAAIPQGLDPDTIRAVLTYHVVQGVFRSGDFTDDNRALTTLLADNPAFVNVTGGQVLNAKLDEGSVLINDDFMVSFAGSTVEAEASVTTADVEFTGGVVHIINSVLIPPTDIVTTLGTRQNDNVDLSTLVTVLSGSGVADTVAGASDITLFAPNNPAWEGLDLAALSSEVVDSTLSYHVISGTVAYSSILQSGNVTTLQGQDVMIEVIDEDNIRVNNARVILPDILTASGVVHIIDQVLSPGAAADGNVDTPDDDDDDDPETVNSASSLSFSAWALLASLSMAMAL